MRKLFRKLIRRLAWFFTLVGVVMFVVATYMKDTNPALRLVWQISALTGLFAFAIDSWFSWAADKENEVMRRQIYALTSRKLSESGRTRMKERLSKYAAEKQQMGTIVVWEVSRLLMAE